MTDQTLSEALQPFWTHPATSGVFSDYDGTLAPIVADPALARAFPGAIEVLRALAGRLRRVGIISGRPASFLVDHLGGRGLFLSGLYGLETVDVESGRVLPLPESLPWIGAVDEVATRAERFEFTGLPPGVGVERKGLSLTLHFRFDPTLEEVVWRWAETEANRTGLVAHLARMAVELRPPVAANKGTALLAAADGLGRVMFVGDDFADLDAFDTLDELERRGCTVLRVAVASKEGPSALVSRADLVVGSPSKVMDLFTTLLAGF